MCRKTLSRRIVGRREKFIVEVTKNLAAAHYICTTADAWSVDGRGYMGVTAHWIDSTTLERKSAALACRRLMGSHTFDVIANSMLNQYVHVKQVFIRYNTPIPSSAPVERLFSVAGLIRTAKRNRLSDHMFETLVLLKANLL